MIPTFTAMDPRLRTLAWHTSSPLLRRSRQSLLPPPKTPSFFFVVERDMLVGMTFARAAFLEASGVVTGP